MNERGVAACSLATLGSDEPLEFFSKEKKCHCVRNIAKLGTNGLTREII